MSADLMCLDNIREFLEDGDGIVTYRWLSHTLSVPCNVAKQMLYSYWEQNHSTDDLYVTYLISGLYQREKEPGKSLTMVVTLADEGELDAVKSKLAKLATVHVYSLQKAPLRDRSLLHAFDDKLTEEQLLEYPKWSSIKCSAVERPPPNREGTSASVKSAVDVTFSTEKPPTLSFMETKSAPVLSREENTAEREIKDSAASKKGASGGSKGSKVKGKSGVAAMFNRRTDLEQEGKPTSKEDKRRKEGEAASSVPSKGKHSPKKKHVKKVSGMELQEETSVEPVATLSAAAAETEDDSGQAGKKSDLGQAGKKSDFGQAGKKSDLGQAGKKSDLGQAGKKSDSGQAGKKSDLGQAGKKSDSGQAGKKRTAQETGKGAKNAEKRRRVVVFSSDSEGEQHEKESESCKENLYSTHDEAKTKKVEPVSTTTSTTVQKRRKRVRRLKSRMFEDSDGSMITEKYYESDSTDASSDDEAPPPLSSSTNPSTAVTEQPVSTGSEEKESKKTTKKGRSTLGTKQKSLTSFFKKP